MKLNVHIQHTKIGQKSLKMIPEQALSYMELVRSTTIDIDKYSLITNSDALRLPLAALLRLREDEGYESVLQSDGWETDGWPVPVLPTDTRF